MNYSNYAVSIQMLNILIDLLHGMTCYVANGVSSYILNKSLCNGVVRPSPKRYLSGVVA